MTVVTARPTPVVLVERSVTAFPVHRIYCVGMNYADHVREMGGQPVANPPVFFSKPADAVLADGEDFPYPPRSENVHHEVELVVALSSGGRDVPKARALEAVYGYAVGIDWTRRDLQWAAKHAGQPWDVAKGFDHSAGIGRIHRVRDVGHPTAGAITLSVNGQRRQASDLSSMIWGVADIIAELSTYYTLQAGDLIYTGTPEGVGAVVRGDVVEAAIEGLGRLTQRVV
jgi:fumarylpyruvate hydrolase